MKKANHWFILMAFALVCLMPIRVQALAQLDDSLYNCLFNGASPDAYNTGAVLIYRGWHYGPLGYRTEMIKAIPHLNVINLTGQTLQFTSATGCFPQNVVGQSSLMRENTPTQKYAYGFDLIGSTSSNPSGYIGSDDYNDNPGPQGTAGGDSEWYNSLNKSGASDLVMSVGSNSFGLHVDWTSSYNGLEATNADLVTMSLRDIHANKYASYLVNNNIVNRGLVYLTGYTDSNGRPFEVFLVTGDRINITFLVKYVNS